MHAEFILSVYHFDPSMILGPCMVIGSWSLWLLLFGPRLLAPAWLYTHACTACPWFPAWSLGPAPWLLVLGSWPHMYHSSADGGEEKPLYTFNSHAFWFVNSEISAMSHWMPCIQLNWTFDWHGAAQDFAYFAFTYRTIYAWLLPLYIWWSSGLLLALWKRARCKSWRATRLPVDGASFHPTMTQLARQSGPAESNKKLLHGGNSRS